MKKMRMTVFWKELGSFFRLCKLAPRSTLWKDRGVVAEIGLSFRLDWNKKKTVHEVEEMWQSLVESFTCDG